MGLAPSDASLLDSGTGCATPRVVTPFFWHPFVPTERPPGFGRFFHLILSLQEPKTSTKHLLRMLHLPPKTSLLLFRPKHCRPPEIKISFTSGLPEFPVSTRPTDPSSDWSSTRRWRPTRPPRAESSGVLVARAMSASKREHVEPGKLKNQTSKDYRCVSFFRHRSTCARDFPSQSVKKK